MGANYMVKFPNASSLSTNFLGIFLNSLRRDDHAQHFLMRTQHWGVWHACVCDRWGQGGDGVRAVAHCQRKKRGREVTYGNGGNDNAIITRSRMSA